MIEELKVKVETFYAIQKIRIQAQLRIGAFQRDERLLEAESQSLHLWVDELLKRMEGQIKREVEVLLKEVPIWTEWMKLIRGVGPCLGGSLYAGIYDIKRFATISKLWAYSLGKIIDGRAARRKSGQKIDWNPFLRMTIYKLTDSFVKQDGKKSFYRHRYDIEKARYQELHPEEEVVGKTKDGKDKKLYTKLHIHNMAKRKVGKMFLQHLMEVWCGLEGIDTNGFEPWILAWGGHTHKITPQEVLEYEADVEKAA